MICISAGYMIERDGRCGKKPRGNLVLGGAILGMESRKGFGMIRLEFH